MDPHVDDGQLNALLDGELDTAERKAVEAHLAGCAECRVRYEEARAFLAGASDLLGMLDAPAAPAAAPPAIPAPRPVPAPLDRRVAPTAQEPAIVLPGPGVERTAKEKAVDPAARVARTGQEPVVDVPAVAPVAPTAEVPALPADLPTAKTPAVRPIFAQRGEGEPPAGRFLGASKLAWAAMLIIGVGAGWMANEALRRPRPATDLAAVPSEQERTPADTAAAPARVSPPASASGAPAARSTTAGRSALVKPRTMRGDKPPTADEAAARIPRERPSGVTANDLAARSRDAAGAAGAGIASTPARAPAPAGALATAPPAAPSPAATQPARAMRPPVSAQAPARAEEAPATAFQRITMDEAVRRLSGSIRLIDGLQPARVEVGPGRLVPGAAPDREVVRVYYAGDGGLPLILDQQPGDSPAAASVNGLMRGDTLVTAQPDGSVRVRWVDRKSFWLSLTGTGSVDSVRTMVERIR